MVAYHFGPIGILTKFGYFPLSLKFNKGEGFHIVPGIQSMRRTTGRELLIVVYQNRHSDVRVRVCAAIAQIDIVAFFA